MTIITECTDCGNPIFIRLSAGEYAPYECDNCGEDLVIQMTRMPGGKTYSEDDFVDDVLPGLHDVERIDHPTEDVYVYGNPDVTKPE